VVFFIIFVLLNIKIMIKFIPTNCTECGHGLSIITGKNGKLKLVCSNTVCSGVAIKKFQKGMTSFGISGIGPAVFIKLYESGVRNIVDLLSFTKEDYINSGVFKDGRSLDKMMESILSLKNIKLSNIIESLQIDGVGETISKEVEKFILTGKYNPSGMEYSIREQIDNPNSELHSKINEIVDNIAHIRDVNVIGDTKPNKTSKSDTTIIIEMTGSPKPFGFNTKSDFIEVVSQYGVIQGSLNKDCHYLVTDDLSSMTSKMSKAQKLGVKVVTYSDLIEILKN